MLGWAFSEIVQGSVYNKLGKVLGNRPEFVHFPIKEEEPIR